MSQIVSPYAGKAAPASTLVDVGKLLAAYADLRPDPSVPAQRIAFGTSGHRGSSLDRSFNEWHILAMSQAICDYRKSHGIDGPLFIGLDTHALSLPAFDNALEVLAANGVDTMIAAGGEFTPTPAISHAILVHNRGRSAGLADGIVITPSHNPPDSGGFKYNASNGGPAGTAITQWVQDRANALIEAGLDGVRRMPLARARKAASTREHDYLNTYVADLANIIDFDLIRAAGVHMGVDPLGGAGVHYWAPIAERYRLDLTVVSDTVDPQFAFMSADWDGKIRMDPSSKYAMQRLIGLKDRYDVAFACDTDHDRHGVVTRSAGLMEPNHYLSVLIDYLFQHRPRWSERAAVGKTVVTTALIDRVARRLGRRLFEAPVGFKWFSDGLLDGSLGFGCEESAGASLLRRDGTVWATDKDGMVPALLSAEITARRGEDPGAAYARLTDELGQPFASRVDAAATSAQKAKLAKLSPDPLRTDRVAGEMIERVLSAAPGNGEPIGGIKVVTAGGWFAARPSGTEAIYKIYAESFKSEAHLQTLLREAQGIVDAALE
ncbi:MULTISPECIES: phosphoglucomutase (alpha-D-glucose-1,6-bisphosphate-dependent) [unclassified Lysobacter]|uniref:phosphoglucomutase (alpha-D-glucose-1,6-bisphosphate-dependent) n=1 Tax=unclassified Lysobacter TaxID=2635362 RepID=UPI001BE5099D|nr:MULTISPECIES: phosphoglucomutase (alpha-D-glucose-1,6-bisphosphate-dependent) [unclassified Lysobacter]MBT2744805.1 phosphoglucomutase (alpha-D-glucose-1,6-bisphosphate-dependent) [Lysobacter sp. ISL-42]MBT2752202.1 phosphoglucomutase (alpha-D-glucose-1,6-bisphosphate-dependent) [Lysobacter sp. ISL-50]MBT2778699.1 phosphoglucomutase (alpha-D-glucose-1,6-bisphosphate-dependent) [Lysobacter sp. ISL-54]MBT2780370.1 phosphoglucomutase (alpha-D-glucose-1,6-bisphosphate-dependent) [Lysobacter sp. 